MMFDTELLIGVGLGAAAGTPIGYFLGFQRKRTADGGSILVPVIDHRPLRQRIREANPRQMLAWLAARWLMVVMVAVLIAGFVQQQAFTYRQRECNDKLWSTIAQRAAIGEDTQTAGQENSAAVYNWVHSWLALSDVPPADRGNRAIESLRQYERDYNASLAKQKAAASKRAATPYPKC